MDRIWSQVVSEFRQVCLLKRQGKVEESERLLSGELTRNIALWSQEAPQDATTKRQTLHDMFVAEERRVEDAWQIQQMVLNEMRESVAAQVRAQIREELEAALAAYQPPPPQPPEPTRASEPSPEMASEDAPIAASSIESSSEASIDLRGAPHPMEEPPRELQPPEPLPAISPSQRGPSADDLPAVIDFIFAEHSGENFRREALAVA
ncbi:MAG: hypothetical protein HYR88_00610 [Verrucomicrobia bacterium]|nr:hypothetical protein [Verrucomicrobiota bacterium]MBI3871115.1 hypothetical protein [Verrucomicrobiota bacterium]